MQEGNAQVQCHAQKQQPSLALLGHLQALLLLQLLRLSVFQFLILAECEGRLAECLRNDKLPTMDLVEAITCAKVKCVEGSVRACHQLQQDVLSHALMAGTGFDNIDFLTCCKFAEGDSRILQQKMSRDRMKRFQKEVGKQSQPHEGVEPHDWAMENEACADLLDKMLGVMTEQRVDKQVAWDSCWEEVYELSELLSWLVQ